MVFYQPDKQHKMLICEFKLREEGKKDECESVSDALCNERACFWRYLMFVVSNQNSAEGRVSLRKRVSDFQTFFSEDFFLEY